LKKLPGDHHPRGRISVDYFDSTEYFRFTRSRPDRKMIKDEWLLEAMQNPLFEQKQSDGRLRKWIWIEEEAKFLRVVFLEDERTIHNAFFDRRFKQP
jgi:hypothetical protein